ncbi:unnamed protein product [Arctia plantaginis]|uniref:Uncharacterized protein n=1 Tax=Arctia plantaginis TaxID=874455 RepID=A0A8S1B793_ARCPL|nr:unnamed protein product [Arctia plantaginis]CAB3253978.1 unnamed protein product [Arctia plantaginis]
MYCLVVTPSAPHARRSPAAARCDGARPAPPNAALRSRYDLPGEAFHCLPEHVTKKILQPDFFIALEAPETPSEFLRKHDFKDR